MKKLITALFICAVVAGCSSAKKKADAADAGAVATPTETPDTAVSNKDINFDAKGSDGGSIEGLYTVNFDYDDAKISADTKAKLDSNAKWIKSHKDTSVQIEGHCDDRGSIEYNLALGERRAKAIKAYLVRLGADGGRMSIISYGKEKPIADGESEEARAKNRRGNFVPIAK